MTMLQSTAYCDVNVTVCDQPVCVHMTACITSVRKELSLLPCIPGAYQVALSTEALSQLRAHVHCMEHAQKQIRTCYNSARSTVETCRPIAFKSRSVAEARVVDPTLHDKLQSP